MASTDDLTVTLTPRERLHLLCASDLQHAAQHGDAHWMQDAIWGFRVANLSCAELHALAEKLNPTGQHADAITQLLSTAVHEDERRVARRTPDDITRLN